MSHLKIPAKLRRETAVALSQIEVRDPQIMRKLRGLFHMDSFKRSICFTGPAGVGKSSLISRLLSGRKSESSLAWLACDPSSMVTKGSLLGDRIRLQGTELSANIFVRSLSTRSTQAFSPAIRDMEVYLENVFDDVWVETAGAGQTQQEVTQISGMSILILQPETGDEIQWMKSGVRELADIFVVHKCDLRGASQMQQSLIENGAPQAHTVMVSSKSGEGLQELLAAIQNVRSQLDWKKRLRALHEYHARELYFEREMAKVERQFDRVKARYLKNPYGV